MGLNLRFREADRALNPSIEFVPISNTYVSFCIILTNAKEEH